MMSYRRRMFWHRWEEWPCTHACTAFFSIPFDEIAGAVPAGLVPERDAHGRGKIEVGYVRFAEGTHGLPATEELAWGIAVERKEGTGFAFYAMNIAADNEPFLALNQTKGFTVHRPPARFTTDLDRRSFSVEDASGPICVLRHQPEGSVPVPFFPVNTEVWTGSAGRLQRRLFKWRGVASIHFAASVATTLHPNHPFFRGVRVERAEPLPSNIFASKKVASAAQLFTAPIDV